jgi:hypothetical protein
MKLRRGEEFFFQLAFFRCHARRRIQWNDIEVEVTAGDLCCTFLFDSGTDKATLKKETARKLLVELQNHVECIQDFIDRS